MRTPPIPYKHGPDGSSPELACHSLPTCTGGEESHSDESLLPQLLQGMTETDSSEIFSFFSFDAHCHVFLIFPSIFSIYVIFFSISYHGSVLCFLSSFSLVFFISFFYHIAYLFLVSFMLPFLTHISPSF